MKRAHILIIAISVFAAGLTALEGEISFVIGTVDFRSAGGALEYADFGMPLKEGDSIITGYDGEAEISLPNGSTVYINPDTVFTFQRASIAPDREPENVFDVVRGQVAFKFNQLGSDEPNIRGRSAIAGVRGTEFTVVVGADGQSLFVVSDGAIEVTSGGRSVALGQDEGVAVNLETGVGEVFPALEGEIDFSDFLAEADAAALADPAGTLESLIPVMEEYLAAAENYRAAYRAAEDRRRELQDEIMSLRENGDDAKADEIAAGEFAEMRRAAVNASLNERFYALSVQSLRRYVISTLYVRVRSNELRGEPADNRFMELYNMFNRVYESRVIDFYVPADI
jgi:hypothetical protein